MAAPAAGGLPGGLPPGVVGQLPGMGVPMPVMGVPMPGMVDAMRCMREASLVLLSEEQQKIAGPYFDYLIKGMQTST